eukprot:TRINITY_DN24235_c0_g1_i1.p1 TRINITY_DN24235_c0_g1~~TRINITY_DN24235_c0_g1_i1.p1  ORF type:complete len:215 (-),score=43.49 TRINITY_DN24235_c0_g1_i1:138-782(-)
MAALHGHFRQAAKVHLRQRPLSVLALRLSSSQVSTPKLIVEKDFPTQVMLLALPLRNLLRSLRLQPLNLVFQRPPWDAAEFSQGCAEAFRQVSALRDGGDYASLRGLVSEKLAEELQSDAEVSKKAWSKRCLLEVRPLGIWTTRLWPDENKHLSLWVTQVLRAVEEYDCPTGSGQRWHVERLHRWTFKRVLQNDHSEEVSDWKLVGVDKGCWKR